MSWWPERAWMPLPPLLLADRVTGLIGEPGGMGRGTVWTEDQRIALVRSWLMALGRSPKVSMKDEMRTKSLTLHLTKAEGGGIIAPPSFAQAVAQFDPDYHLRPKPGQKWFGSAKGRGKNDSI